VGVSRSSGGLQAPRLRVLKALPSASYCLVDIQPALNVAQEYLTRVFPGEKAFCFRPFRRYEEICSEFESSRVRFLAAQQIELLPPPSSLTCS